MAEAGRTSPLPLANLLMERKLFEEILLQYFKKEEIEKDQLLPEYIAFQFKLTFCAVPANSFTLSGIYFDATYNFVLFREKEAIASIGFYEIEEGVLQVMQIQGVRGRKENLRILRWERFLLRLLCVWAKSCGFKEVRVLSSAKNNWAGGRQKEFYLKYDVTARREKFIKDPATGCYTKSLI